MALIVRIDVDRPYGKTPLARHLFSRLSSDLYCPVLPGLGYLAELETMLGWLNAAGAKAHVFFRRCTLPSARVMDLLRQGGHDIGLHLENSRSLKTFQEEVQILERHAGRKVRSVSKHGSGGHKYGFHHYAPYEPERYAEWAHQSGLQVFLGNLEDPAMSPASVNGTLTVFPAAFWLEPHWRDTVRYPVEWVEQEATRRDVVMLVHPENVTDDAGLTADFQRLISRLPTRIL